MPITPRFAFYLSHNERNQGYIPIPGPLVQELNRRTRFHCEQWFIPWQGEIRDFWFEEAPAPEDRWENTPEGQRAAELRKEHEEMERRYRERMESKGE